MSSIVGESCQFILISSLWRELVSYQFPWSIRQ
jgi:hypothetical protein